MIFPSRFVNLAAARQRFGDRVDRLGHFLSAVDPVADRVVESIDALPAGVGWRWVTEALRSGTSAIPEAPRAIHDLIEEVCAVPAWVDWATCDRGGRVFMRAGLLGGAVLGASSLVLGYASPGGNKPLVLSGRLQEHAVKRLNETARFVQAVSRPRGMRPFAEGWQITVKVRLIHARVRRMILASGRWNATDWGAPVNQHDMAGTTLLFSIAILGGLRKLGARVSAEEGESYMHLWRWIGRVIGVDEALLPVSEQDAERLVELMSATMAEPDQDSRNLTRALFDSAFEGARTPAQRREAARRRNIGMALSRELIGDPLADQLALPRTSSRHVLPVVRRIVSGMERVRSRVPLADQRALAAGARYWDRVVEVGLRGATYEFGLPTALAGVAA